MDQSGQKSQIHFTFFVSQGYWALSRKVPNHLIVVQFKDPQFPMCQDCKELYYGFNTNTESRYLILLDAAAFGVISNPEHF